MSSSGNSLQSNDFEILMEQLHTTCPPGFLKKPEQKSTVVAPIEVSKKKKRGRFVPPLEEKYFGQSDARKTLDYPRPKSACLPPISPHSPNYRPRALYRARSQHSPRVNSYSPRAYRPSMSPRTPTFERNRSWHQSRNNSRRLYVFNIPKEVTEQEFRNYFSQFGPLTSCGFDLEEKYRKDTKSGFIAFKDLDVTDEVVKNDKQLKLGENEIRVKRATSQRTQLFVGGYDLHTTKTELISFFSQYGEVCDFVMKFNAEGVNRCFGFLTFRDSEDAANKLIEERFLECLGKTVEIKRATQNKRSFNSYGGTPMNKRYSHSPRFARDSLEHGGGSFNRSCTKSDDLDVPIDGTKMYSRKFFAPTRRGMGSKNNSTD